MSRAKTLVYVLLFGTSLMFVLLATAVQNGDRLPALVSSIRERWTPAVATSSPPSSSSSTERQPQASTPKLSPASAELAIGTNLAGIADWSTQMPFLDAFKSSRNWITQCRKSDPGCKSQWSTGEFEQLDLDARGWVKSLPAPEAAPEYTSVSTLMFREIPQGQYPGGEYVVFYEGEGEIEYFFDAKKNVARSRSGRDIIEVTPSENGIGLRITATDPERTGNYLRNIHVVPIAYEQTFTTEIFNPKWLDRIRPFSVLRFMDWMKTNNSQQSEWADRPHPDDARYGMKGVPLEIMLALVERLPVDPWFCMPHLATDEYLREFAKLVEGKLPSDRTVYVEYSNEVWNWQFRQTQYASQRGQERWGKEVGDAFVQWYGMRAAQVSDIWHEVFGDRGDRLVTVLATQAAYHGLERAILDCPRWVAEGNTPCRDHGFRAYAIAPYFSGVSQKKHVPQLLQWLEDPEQAKTQLFTHLRDRPLLEGAEQTALAKMAENMAYHSRVAREENLPLYAYEGGQHLLASGNRQVTDFLIDVNRDERMYEVYEEMLQLWQENGGSLFVNFNDIDRPSKWGSWGVLEHVDQATSPKYRALLDFIAREVARDERG